LSALFEVGCRSWLLASALRIFSIFFAGGASGRIWRFRSGFAVPCEVGRASDRRLVWETFAAGRGTVRWKLRKSYGLWSGDATVRVR